MLWIQAIKVKFKSQNEVEEYTGKIRERRGMAREAGTNGQIT